MPPNHLKVVKEDVYKMFQAGQSTAANSARPIFDVIDTKKDKNPQLFVGYRELNRGMKGDR